MEKVLKRVAHHKKQASPNCSSSSKRKNYSASSSSSINKRYSVDDNFYTYDTCSSLKVDEQCNGTNYFTISNRGDFKRNRPTSSMRRSKSIKQTEFAMNGDKQQLTSKDDVTFKKFLKVFNTGGENSRGAKDWFASNASNVMDFMPKILTKRSGGKKGENELYRSNSFKFERFERTDSDTLSSSKKSPVSRQISLCDDYSLPVDFVNKRPLSLDSGSFWSAQSPNGDQIEVLNLYCDPKDSKSQQNLTDKSNFFKTKNEVVEEKTNLYSAAHKEYCHPCDDTTDDGDNEDDEPGLYENLKNRNLNALAGYSKNLSQKNNGGSGAYTEIRKSPYYYGDLLVKRNQNESQPSDSKHIAANRSNESDVNSIIGFRNCQSSITSTSEINKNGWSEPVYSNDAKFFDGLNIEEENEEDLLDEDEEMAGRQRHMYETAFDSKICNANETLELDTVANHVMERCSPQLPYNPAFVQLPADSKCSLKRLAKCKINGKYKSSIDSLTQHLLDMDMNEQSTLLHGYSSASTSTIPLPQSANLNDSMDSFSESSHAGGGSNCITTTTTTQPSDGFFLGEMARKHSCCNDSNGSNNNNNNGKNKIVNNINNNRRRHKHQKPLVSSSLSCYRNKDAGCCASDSPSNDTIGTAVTRPKSCRLSSKILEIKSRPARQRGHKFSSTESMTTSSSGGSLESIRSSTSEGNCSTTSMDSRRSSSLSSHSSDSAVGSGGYHFSLNFPSTNRYGNQAKMHVLSPISDKSFQEGGSEGSEINRNINSQMVFPEDQPNCAASPTMAEGQNIQQDDTTPVSGNAHKTKRRPLQNKNLISLSVQSSLTKSGDVETQQCSDSGISIESRSDTQKLAAVNDFSDLPFDMPKLRRRRLQQMQEVQNSTQDTSSSATSVDLKDLPFDMPKLRRKLRSSSTQESGAFSFDEPGVMTNENNLGDDANKPAISEIIQGRNRKSLGLSLNLNEIIPAGCNIDADLPLERQGWYHGTITRMEAENELRNREEGSYLVRNSESAKHDYSLSLKSAKGFMHMRIQKSSDTSKFILGQFSSPFDSIPLMIKHYSSNQLPIRGAEHMCLLQPVIAQLL